MPTDSNVPSFPSAEAGAVSPTSSHEQLQDERLGQALNGLRTSRIPRLAGSPASVARGYETVQDIVDPWISLARAYQGVSQSPADRKRWEELVLSVSRPNTGRPGLEGLVMLTSNARGLLGALVEAGQPGLQVHEISEHVVKAVADGTYGQGTAHSVKTVAAALETPVSRVALAFDDLARAGIINVSVAGRATVVGGTSPSAGRATDVAAWLTALIQAGVYPAGTPLPPIPRLSTAFVAHKTDVRAALRILQQSRVVQCRRKAVARVEMALPFPADAPPDPLRLAKRLRTTKSAPDLDFDTAVSAAARRARNWWRSRTNVDPDVLSRHIDVMRLMAGHLLPMATSQVTCCEDEVVLRRAAVTACLPWPEEAKGRSWRAACLGTALTELLLIKSRPAPPPPEGPRTTASTSGFLAQP